MPAMAAQEHRHVLVGEARPARHRGPDGGTGIDDRGLRPDAAAETDGHGAGRHRRPGIVGLDVRFVLGYRLQDFRHAVADVVFENVADKQHRKQHTHAGIYQQQQSVGRIAEPGSQPGLDPVDQGLEQDCRTAAQQTDQDRKQQQFGFVGKQSGPPSRHLLPRQPRPRRYHRPMPGSFRLLHRLHPHHPRS